MYRLSGGANAPCAIRNPRFLFSLRRWSGGFDFIFGKPLLHFLIEALLMKCKSAFALGGIIGESDFESMESAATVEREIEHFTQPAVGDRFCEFDHPVVFDPR